MKGDKKPEFFASTKFVFHELWITHSRLIFPWFRFDCFWFHLLIEGKYPHHRETWKIPFSSAGDLLTNFIHITMELYYKFFNLRNHISYSVPQTSVVHIDKNERKNEVKAKSDFHSHKMPATTTLNIFHNCVSISC